MTDDRIIEYLLEELPEEDLERFLDEYCDEDENLHLRIDLAEEDLIDAYLRNELTQERRQRFEQNYLTPDRQERVSMAAALLRHVDGHSAAATKAPPASVERLRVVPSRRITTLRAATAFALVAVMATALWFLIRQPSLHGYATLTLTISHGNRSDGAQVDRVKLPANAEGLKITLTLPEQRPPAVRYRVELEDESGEPKLSEAADQDAQSVEAVIPASQLARGQYALKLFAVKADGSDQRVSGSYLFIVE